MELRSTFEGPSEIPASCPPCSICAASGFFCQDILLLDRECNLMALCDRRRGFFSGGLASPGGEVLQTRAHLGRRLAIQKVQQPQLFTDGVALLESEDDPGVLPACEDPVRVEQTEVFDVEAVQYPPVAGGATQMVFVASTDHPAVQSGQNVDAPRAQVFLLFFRSWFSFLYVLVSLRNWFGASPNVARCRVGISNDQEPPLRFVGVPLVQSAQQPDFLPKYFWSTRFHGMAGWNLRR